MEASAVKIEKLFQEKIFLYQDLIECLNSERKSLMNADIDFLWKLSDKKQVISVEIEKARSKILDVLDDISADHGMDISTFNVAKVLSHIKSDVVIRLRKLEVTLNISKKNVHALAGQNRAYVEEYLAVIDELVGIISNVEGAKGIYSKNSCPEIKSKTSMLFHKEV